MAVFTSLSMVLAGCLGSSVGFKMVVPKMPASDTQGTWTYEDPVETDMFGQYMYTSPMNRTCIRNLTVKAFPCAGCSDSPMISPVYFDKQKQCIPHCLEGIALLTDQLNSRTGVLQDACIQLVVSHINFTASPPHHLAIDLSEAVRRSPRKHGAIWSGWYGVDNLLEAAANMAVPVVRSGPWLGGGFSEEPINPMRLTEFRTKTDRRWYLPGIIKRFMPAKFAVMTDTETAGGVLEILKSEATKHAKTVALSRVILSWGNGNGDVDTIQKFVDEMVKQEIRYLIIVVSSPHALAALACYLHKHSLHRVIQVVSLGFLPALAIIFSGNMCHWTSIYAAIVEGAWTGVEDYTGYGGFEDYIINRATGGPGKLPANQAFNLAGDPWQDHFGFGELQPTLACTDDKVGVNASNAFRALLQKDKGETVHCHDVLFMGQSRNVAIARDVARYCPISACAYNSLMAACRMSCACSLADPASALQHPDGGALCGAIESMPNVFDPGASYRAEHWRCEGQNCRELAFAPSRIAFMEPLFKLAEILSGHGGGFCPSITFPLPPYYNTSTVMPSCFSFPGYPPIYKWAMWYHEAEQADAVYSFALAFECMEKKGQLVDFIESDYGDTPIRESLLDCMVNNVSFEGMSGRISFDYLQSPPPGHTYSHLTQDDNFQLTISGAVLQDDVLLFDQVVSQENAFSCEQWTSSYAPGKTCYGKTIGFNLDENNWQVFPLGSPSDCPAGEYPITIGEDVEGVRLDECAPCPPGTYKETAGPTRCLPCPPGWAAASSGQSTCQPCGLGNRSAAPGNATELNLGYVTQVFGAIGCDHCDDGYDSEVGSSECLECPVGRYRDVGVSIRELGVLCTACPIGRYIGLPGGSHCEECPEGLSTKSTSSTSLAECFCSAGTYKSGSLCYPCPQGMTCVAGSDEANFPGIDGMGKGDFETHPYPLTDVSFYTTAEEPLAPFRCRRERACPGGPPGSCSGTLTGLTCVRCPEGKFFRLGECSQCDTAGGLLVLGLSLVMSLFGVTTLHVLTNWPSAKTSMPIVIGGLIMGMAVNFFLTVVSFSALNMVWGPPLSDLFVALSVFKFNFDSFNFFCALGITSYFSQYVIRLLLVPIFFAQVVVGAFVSSRVPRLHHIANFNVPSLMNSAGFVMSMFFIAVGLTSLEGFRCIRNPNERWTLLANTSLICFEGGEHTQIMIVSVCAVLCCPVLFLAFNFWVSVSYAKYSLKYGVWFTDAVRYLTLRVRPEFLHFAFAWYCRGFLVALLPVLAADEYEMQIGLLMGTFILWLTMQTYFNCWRFEWVNVVDPILGVCTILLLFGFAMLGQTDDRVSTTIVGWFIIVVGVATLLLLTSLAAYNIVAHISSKTSYSFFITHHKAAAALYARQVKMMLELPSFSSPFLDVDDLDHLDKVAFSVKASSRDLVILTKSLLERPWCALEVATAYLNHIPISVVQLNDDVVELSPEYLEQVVSSFSVEDWGIFSQYGITKDMLVETFDHLAQLPRIVYPLRTSNLTLLDQCVRDTLGADANKFKKPIFAVDPSKVVNIVYNTKDDLQASAAYVTFQLFREFQWDAMLCGTDEQAFPDRINAKKGVGVILLSKGLPTDPTAMGMLLAMQRSGSSFVTVLSQENFWSPDAEFLEALQNGRGALSEGTQMQEAQRLAPGATFKEFADVLPLLYTQIAMNLAPEMNERLMHGQFKFIEERARNQLEIMTMKSTSDSPTASPCISPRGKIPSAITTSFSIASTNADCRNDTLKSGSSTSEICRNDTLKSGCSTIKEHHHEAPGTGSSTKEDHRNDALGPGTSVNEDRRNDALGTSNSANGDHRDDALGTGSSANENHSKNPLGSSSSASEDHHTHALGASSSADEDYRIGDFGTGSSTREDQRNDAHFTDSSVTEDHKDALDTGSSMNEEHLTDPFGIKRQSIISDLDLCAVENDEPRVVGAS